MKLTANSSILTLLKAHMIIRIADFPDAPFIRGSMEGKRAILAYRPKNAERRVFYWSERGLTDALQWAANGWVQIDNPTSTSQEVPQPK